MTPGSEKGQADPQISNTTGQITVPFIELVNTEKFEVL